MGPLIMLMGPLIMLVGPLIMLMGPLIMLVGPLIMGPVTPTRILHHRGPVCDPNPNPEGLEETKIGPWYTVKWG